MADKQAFVQSIYDAGIAAGLTDAAARVMAGQAALESAYGEDPDAARTLNFFGIKGGNEWTGPVDVRPTIEGSGKNAKTVDQAFRVYSTVEQGIADRVAFMDLHFPAFSQSKTVGDAFDSLQHGAYGPHGNDGQYFTADRATYEGAVNKVNVTYLKGTPPPPQGIPNIVDVSKGGTAGKALILANNLPLKPRTEPVTGVVFHHTGGSSLAGAVNGSQMEGTQQHGKGATYYIDTDGSIYQYADVEKVMNGIRSPSDAYRTDKGKPTDKLSNNSTISIEVVGLDSNSFTPAQKAAAASLGAYLAKQYNIAPSMIVGHGDLQGGPGGNKQPTEGVELAAYVRDQIGSNPAVDAINQAVPGIGTLGHRGAEPQARISGAFADVRDPPARATYDSRLSELDVIRTSAAYGIRRPPAAAPAKIPKPEEFVSFDDVFTAEQFMPDGGRDYSKLSGANRGFDPVGPGPSSWFTSGKDAAPYFGAKETGRSSQVISVVPITSAAGVAGAGAGAAGAAALNAPVPPTPMPGRPAGLDAVAPKPAEPAAAPAAVAEAPAKQTVRVGKHNYEVGATFDQGGFHYTVTPDGIQKSRIPTGEKTLVGGIIGQVVKEKLKEAVPEVTAQVGTTAAAALEATKQKGAALVEQAQKIGSTFSGLGGAFSGLFGGGTPAPATDRLAEVIHKGYAGGVANLGPVDLGVEFDKRVTITPYPPAQIQLVAPKFAGGVKEIAFANLNVPGAPKPVERETQVVEHKIVPVKTSMSTVEPPKGSIARVGSDQKIEHVGATSVKTVPTAKPTYKSVTSPNPAYEAWVSKQTRSTGGDVKEEHGKAGQVRSSTVDAAASAGPPPPKTVTKQVVVDTPAPIKKSTSVAQPQTSITTTTTTRAAEVTQATRAAAVANDNASGWVSGGNDGTRGPTQTVELASGKVAAVGAIGTAQDGRYVYQVQEDGSVKNLTTGRTSAPATSKK